MSMVLFPSWCGFCFLDSSTRTNFLPDLLAFIACWWLNLWTISSGQLAKPAKHRPNHSAPNPPFCSKILQRIQKNTRTHHLTNQSYFSLLYHKPKTKRKPVEDPLRLLGQAALVVLVGHVDGPSTQLLKPQRVSGRGSVKQGG